VSVRVGDVVKDPALLRPGMRVRFSSIGFVSMWRLR